MKKIVCDWCKCSARPLLCPDCVNNSLEETRTRLRLRELNDTLEETRLRLGQQYSRRAEFDRRKTREARMKAARQNLKERERSVKARLHRLEASTIDLQLKNEARLGEISAVVKDLRKTISSEVESNLRNKYELQLLEAREKESEFKIKEGVLQLASAIGMRRSSKGGEIMGVVLPRMVTPLPGIEERVLRDLGAVLGYVYLFAERLSWATECPLMHVGRFECSTSHVMKPDRIFGLHRHPYWGKYRLYLSPEDSHEKWQSQWPEVVTGVQLLKRSLRCFAASLDIEMTDPRVTLFDLLLLIISRLTKSGGGRVGLTDLMIDDDELRESDDDWFEVDEIILPPPPSAEADIAQYELAMDMVDRSSTLSNSFRSLWPKMSLPLQKFLKGMPPDKN